MKKLIIASLLLIGIQGTVQAQTKEGVRRGRVDPEQRMERKLDMMEKKLDLTPDQKEAIRQVDKKTLAQVQEARKDNRNDVRMIRKEANDEYKKILTEEQYTKFEELRQDRQDRAEQSLERRK